MARSILSLGMLWARAARMALRRRGLPFGSPPPLFAAIVISLENLLKILPRLASSAPLKRLTFDHLLCPAIGVRSYFQPENLRVVFTSREKRLARRRNLPRQLIARKLTWSIAAQLSPVRQRMPVSMLISTRTVSFEMIVNGCCFARTWPLGR